MQKFVFNDGFSPRRFGRQCVSRGNFRFCLAFAPEKLISFLRRLFFLVFEPLYILFRKLQLQLCRGKILLAFTHFGAYLICALQPHGDLKPLFFLAQLKILLRVFSLFFKRTDTCRQLADNIVDAHKIVFGVPELALRLGLAETVLADSGRFLKNRTALVTLCRKHLGNLALTDY